MTKELEGYADAIATACNKVIEELDFDVTTDGVGYDDKGTFYSFVAGDACVGLKEFFNFIKSENYDKLDVVKQIRNDYRAYNVMKKSQKRGISNEL